MKKENTNFTNVITRKNIRVLFSCISFFILLSCSKNNQDKSCHCILNSYTYTLTDTTSVNHIDSDTTMLPPNGRYDTIINGKVTVVEPLAYIWQPDPSDYLRLQFYFTSPASNGFYNALFFALPYYQASVSGTNNLVQSPISLELEGVGYTAAPPQPSTGSRSDPVYLASFTVSTNISDSTNGYITGSFNISATTLGSGKIKIVGQFANLPTTFRP